MYDDIPAGVLLAEIESEEAWQDLIQEIQRRIDIEFIIWGIPT